MIEWTLTRKDLPLKMVWKIAGATLTAKESYFVEIRSGRESAQGEVAPNQRYGSRPEVIRQQFAMFSETWRKEPLELSAPVGEFGKWLDARGICRALRFGLESAWVHLQARHQNVSVARLLGLPEPRPVPTSYSLPIMEIEEFREVIPALKRFQSLKIKVDAERADEIVKEVARLTSQKLRIDGNESFRDPDAVLRFVETLRGKNVEFLEQPMPAGLIDAYRALLPQMPFPLIADESIEHSANFDELKTQFSGINVKLMKAGGYLPAIRLLKSARASGLRTMIGCMVESSLGIASAYQLSTLAGYIDLDSFLLLKKDPFQLMKETHGMIESKSGSTFSSGP